MQKFSIGKISGKLLGQSCILVMLAIKPLNTILSCMVGSSVSLATAHLERASTPVASQNSTPLVPRPFFAPPQNKVCSFSDGHLRVVFLPPSNTGQCEASKIKRTNDQKD